MLFLWWDNSSSARSEEVGERELCCAAKARDGLTIWIRNVAPPAALRASLDIAIPLDCDEVVSLLSC